MFLKNNHKTFPEKNMGRRPNSIAMRLTTSYIVLLLATFPIVFLMSYSALVNHIQGKDVRFLMDKILHLRNILKDEHIANHILEEEVFGGGGYQFHKLFIKLVDINGYMIMVTQGGEDHLSKLPFAVPPAVNEDTFKFTKHRLANGNTFLIMSAWAKSPKYADGRVLINAALDITEEQILLNSYKKILLYIASCGLLFSCALAIIIIRHGLRPLKRISDKIKQMSVAQLHDKLNPQQWPLELVPLVKNYNDLLGRIYDSVKRLSRFSSDIAHDLRTPLQILRGEAEIMLSEERTSEQYQENIRSSLEEYDRLTQLIESLLFIERAENTDVELNHAEFDIKTKTKKIISLYEALIEDKALKVVLNGTGQIISADPLLFERALSNLVSNALKYAKHGGQITFYFATKDDRTVSLSVNNDGPVIDPDDLKQLFDRFFRATYAKSVDYTGLGLGLSIVKSIMDLHGGSAQAQSDTITGTTFTLNFPQSQPH